MSYLNYLAKWTGTVNPKYYIVEASQTATQFVPVQLITLL
jgi:hypothetical protein